MQTALFGSKSRRREVGKVCLAGPSPGRAGPVILAAGGGWGPVEYGAMWAPVSDFWAQDKR